MGRKSTTATVVETPADTTGASHRRKAGLKPVACDLTPEVYELVRQAAFDARVSMSAYVRAAVEKMARTDVGNKNGK